MNKSDISKSNGAKLALPESGEKRSYHVVASDRLIDRHVKAAQQENPLILGIVEILTNSHDAYVRNHNLNIPESQKRIDIEYERRENGSLMLTIADNGGGLRREDLLPTLIGLGEATSGYTKDNNIRGLFGEGLTQSCATLPGSRIIDFIDGKIYASHYENPHELVVEKIARGEVNPLVKKYDKKYDGVVVEIPVAEKYPTFDAMYRVICLHPSLRYILEKKKVPIFFKYKNKGGRAKRLEYVPLKGKILATETGRETYKHFSVEWVLEIRSADRDLRQKGIDREGGILIEDDRGNPLGQELFGYENDHDAQKLFGTLKLTGIRAVMEAGEPILMDRRGLDHAHKLIADIAKQVDFYLRIEIDRIKHKASRYQPVKGSEDDEKAKRLAIDTINDVFNEIMKDSEKNEVIEDANDKDLPEPYVPKNIEFRYRADMEGDFKTIVVNKTYAITLLINANKVKGPTLIKLKGNDTRLHHDKKIIVNPGDAVNGVITSRVEVKAYGLGTYVLRATMDKYQTEIKMVGVPAENFDIAFSPSKLTLHPYGARTIHISLKTKHIKGNKPIEISCSNSKIEISSKHFKVPGQIVPRFSPKGKKNGLNYVQYEIKAESNGVGESGLITAKYGDFKTTMEIEVDFKKDKETPNGSLLKKIEYDFLDKNPGQPTCYDEQDGGIRVFVQYATSRIHFGASGEHLRSISGRTTMAHLITEQAAKTITRKKMEANRSVVGSLNDSNFYWRFERDKNGVVKMLGPKITQYFVPKELLEKSREIGELEKV